MNRLIILVMMISTSLLFGDIKMPKEQFISSGAVIDIVVDDNKLYSSTNAGIVDVFDIATVKKLYKITTPKIKDFMGDLVEAKIYSVDVLGSKVLILSQAKSGYRRVHIYEDDKLTLIIPYTKSLAISKAKFLDENTLLLGMLSNELISYDIKKGTNNWLVQVAGAKFSNFTLNEDKTQVVVCDESGDLKLHNTKDGTLIKILADQNLDNVFQVDYNNGIIATAGQDRRVVIYNTKRNSAYYKHSKFLIYSVGLSPSAKLVGFSSDENNNVTIFNTSTQTTIGKYGNNKMIITNIVFLNEKELLVASDDKTINLYNIK